tara:strand:- start:1343 stop:1789 length:447 start_codon:yes stop_codon:yes gene_type:complete
MTDPVTARSDGGNRFAVTIYWEDTDAAGIVYYANYLKFMERARSDLVARAGIDQAGLLARDGIVFPVRRCCIDYLEPARLGDQLTVTTALKRIGGASLDMQQNVLLAERTLVQADIRLACIGRDGRPRRIPAEVSAALRSAQMCMEGS